MTDLGGSRGAEDPCIASFRTLKPACVELIQVVLRAKSKRATGKEVIDKLERLNQTLQAVNQRSDSLDAKLAEYVFFPLSHVLGWTKELPVRATELALRCLQILITTGWRRIVAPDLGKQLLKLLSFLAGGSSIDAKSKDVNEELADIAFGCLASLFQNLGPAGFHTETAVDTESIPELAYTITVILDGVADGPSQKVRMAALEALKALIHGLSDPEALKNFFPGIVSTLTKVLKSGTPARTPYKILEECLQTLETILYKVLSDDRASGLKGRKAVALNQHLHAQGDPWAKATASQVKLALVNIIPLRYHERTEVQDALFKLCTTILTHCREMLSNSFPIMIETMVAIHTPRRESSSILKATIDSVIAADRNLVETLKSSLHDWIIALPRIMQSNNDRVKKRNTEQISVALDVLAGYGVDFGVLSEIITQNLQASVTAAVHLPSTQIITQAGEENLRLTRIQHSVSEKKTLSNFQPTILGTGGDKVTMIMLQDFAKQLTGLSMSEQLQQRIIKSLSITTGDEQLASLWLSLQFASNKSFDAQDIDQYLDIPHSLQNTQGAMIDEIYSFSLDTLAKPTYDEDVDWRLQALALEAVALQATRHKYDFRPELIDALYPIAERMGSPNEGLQEHALTCLNIISNACGYTSSSELIIGNVDYLVNAIALRLNTFDISPQAPRILVMMITLCGSTLIPYLDDLIESIFSALANYHGYPQLVESLFSVLNAIVEEASKSTNLITGTTPTTHQIPHYEPLSISSLASTLAALHTKSTVPTTHTTLSPSPPSSPPPSPPPPSDPTPSRTYNLIQRITLLTQHHLPSPSPPLRLRLLSLLTTSIPLLSTHTNSFLPLVSTIWPPLLARLTDTTPYILPAVCATITTLCAYTGDFMLSRIEDAWGDIESLYWRWEKVMRREEGQGRGAWGEGRRMWEAVMGLVVGVVGSAGVREGEIEDAVFEMLEAWVGWDGVRDCLERLNGDRLWLVEESERIRKGGAVLEVPGEAFREVEL